MTLVDNDDEHGVNLEMLVFLLKDHMFDCCFALSVALLSVVNRISYDEDRNMVLLRCFNRPQCS